MPPYRNSEHLGRGRSSIRGVRTPDLGGPGDCASTSSPGSSASLYPGSTRSGAFLHASQIDRDWQRHLEEQLTSDKRKQWNRRVQCRHPRPSLQGRRSLCRPPSPRGVDRLQLGPAICVRSMRARSFFPPNPAGLPPFRRRASRKLQAC